MFQNPHSSAIKKYLFEILKERYSRNDKFIDRLASSVSTKDDYESFGNLIVDIFESGFLKAVNEYKDQLAKMGLKVDVVPEKKNQSVGKKIFDQSEKSG